MKVCVDIQSAIGQTSGVGRYTRCLAEALPGEKHADQLGYFYFDFRRNGSPLYKLSVDERVVRWIPGRVVQKAWKTVNFPPFDWFSGKADLFHFPNFIRPPLAHGRSVVTIHDVSFLRFPEATEKKNLQYLTSCLSRTVKEADHIITDSHFSKKELCTLMPVCEEKVTPIHLGLPPATHQSAGKENLPDKISGRPYLLMVGTIEPRKNHRFLFEVFEQLKSYDGLLVLAGMRGWREGPIFERLEHSAERNRIVYLDYVSDQQLATLYQHADAFVFPSLYEGFGFPPLEAMRFGTPVVSSSAGSLPEVLGDAAILCNEFDVELWVEQLHKVLDDTALREQLAERGKNHAQTFSWSRTAKETWDVYRMTMDQGERG